VVEKVLPSSLLLFVSWTPTLASREEYLVEWY